MGINLSKGQKIDLTKGNAGLRKIVVGLGWDTNKYDGGDDFDLDVSAFLLNEAGKARKDEDFVFYNNTEHESRSVFHTGDNRDGAGDGDDEEINIDLSLVPADIHRIAFTVTIHEADARKQNFGQVSSAYIRICEVNTALPINTPRASAKTWEQDITKELLRYDLGEDYSIETAIIFAELYRAGAEWKFNAIGSGFKGGLAALVNHYGLSV
ncbi:TerD family protein [Breznakiellaceae bacterium SP9]